MSVNFTGIKNVGSMTIISPRNVSNKLDVLSLQVTNDADGNDLDEFRKAIEKTGSPKDYETAYEGAVSINVATEEPDEEYITPTHHFFLNGTPLETKDENLAAFSYLAKLTRKISKKDNKELGTTVEYIQTPDFSNGSSLGYFIQKIYEANPQMNLLNALNGIYNPDSVKAGAKKINKAINETMTDYLC